VTLLRFSFPRSAWERPPVRAAAGMRCLSRGGRGASGLHSHAERGNEINVQMRMPIHICHFERSRMSFRAERSILSPGFPSVMKISPFGRNDSMAESRNDSMAESRNDSMAEYRNDSMAEYRNDSMAEVSIFIIRALFVFQNSCSFVAENFIYS
jgi:hypothetical protein